MADRAAGAGLQDHRGFPDHLDIALALPLPRLKIVAVRRAFRVILLDTSTYHYKSLRPGQAALELFPSLGATEEMIPAAVKAGGELRNSPLRERGRRRKYADDAARQRAWRRRDEIRYKIRGTKFETKFR